MTLCFFKRQNTVKLVYCNCSGCTTPPTKWAKKCTDTVNWIWQTSLGLLLFFPSSKVPKILGGREDKKWAFFQLPNPKNNWGSIAATLKPHKHSVKPEIFTLCANSHRTLRFYQYLFIIIQTDQEIVAGKFTSLRVDTSLLPAMFLNYSFLFCQYLRSQLNSN